jgi:hypothetical protein
MILRIVLTTALYVLTAAVCLGIAFSPVAASWVAAASWGDTAGGRLRWCVVVKEPLVKGLVVKQRDVDWTIRRVSEWDDFIPDVKSVVGKYALVDLKEGELVRPGQLAEFAPSATPADKAALPVEVKAEHAVGLRPGMQLAFIREKEEKKVVLLPQPRGAGGQAPGTGFELLSVANASKDAAAVTLTVAVPKAELLSIQDLAVGQWRPIILSSP